MGFGAGKAIAANLSADMQSLFSWAKNMPLLGVSAKGEGKLIQGAKDIRAPFTEEVRTAQDVLNKRIDSIAGDKGMLQGYAEAYNTANGLAGDAAVNRSMLEREFSKAYAGGDQRAAMMDSLRSKYGIADEHMTEMTGALDESARLADIYAKAGKAPFGMAKDYFLDGSPLSMYAKGAVAVTAGQFAMGTRTSLTEKNGEKDIAGIPFI